MLIVLAVLFCVATCALTTARVAYDAVPLVAEETTPSSAVSLAIRIVLLAVASGVTLLFAVLVLIFAPGGPAR